MGIPFCCGQFSGLDLHFGSFWRAIFGPRIFWVLLKTLGILGGLNFCLSFDHPGCLQYTPPRAISNTLCSVSFNSRKIGANVKKFDCALFL